MGGECLGRSPAGGQKNNIDLVVLGTRGRTGMQKFLLGSVAEEVWRRSPVPVLTIGPKVGRIRPIERFNFVLFATDFTTQSLAGLPCAVSMAANIGRTSSCSM